MCSAAPAEALTATALRGAGAAFGRDHAVDAGALGTAQQCAQVLRVFDAVERQQERIVAFAGSKQVFEIGQRLGAHHGDHALMRGGLGQVGQVVAGGRLQANAVFAAHGGDAVELGVGALAGHAHVVKPAQTGPDRLFYRVQPV